MNPEEIQKKVFEIINRQKGEFNKEKLKQSLQNIFNSPKEQQNTDKDTIVDASDGSVSDKNPADIGDSPQSQNLETREGGLGADGNIHGESPDAQTPQKSPKNSSARQEGGCNTIQGASLRENLVSLNGEATAHQPKPSAVENNQEVSK